jgi:aminoglycoside/choline kinase family phosphotransferase
VGGPAVGRGRLVTLRAVTGGTGTALVRGAGSVGLLAKEAARCVVDRLAPGPDPLPMRPSELTPSWLEGALGLPPGTVRSVRVVDDDHGTAARARIAVDADPSAKLPDHLFVKYTPPVFAQRVLMNVMDLGAREVLFYEAIGSGVPVRVPHCHSVQHDARHGRNVMVLEDLSPTARFRDLTEPISPEEAFAVADALADLHAAFWESDRFTGDLSLLVTRSDGANHLADVLVPRLVTRPRGPAADLISPATAEASRVLLDRRADVEAFWRREPRTLTHGDPHLGNLFFEGDGPGFLDWQATMAGPGIRDVAYFLNASVDVPIAREVERELVHRYVARLGANGIAMNGDATWTRYRAAISEFYIAAVVTAGTSERMQRHEVTRAGVERAVAAAEANDTFAVLGQLLDSG